MSESNLKLSVACNFDLKFVDQIKNFPVTEIYGKLPSDFIGGGRSTYMISPIGTKKLTSYVKYCRDRGIAFNYLLNASCLDNLETTREGQKKIRALLAWVNSIGASAVTISNPFILRIIKKHYPKLRCRVSVFAGVDHLQKARYWQDLGADCICLDSLTVNRDQEALCSLRAGVSCDLELLANGNCFQSCSLSPTHMNLLSHSSQSTHKNHGMVIDHCLLECSKRKLLNPVHYIRSDWIRPEDIKIYQQLGYHHFKIVERDLPTPIMIKRVTAYSEGKYEGNLIDLIQPYGHADNSNRYDWKRVLLSLRYFFAPLKVNLSKMLVLKKLAARRGMLHALSGAPPIVIDNQHPCLQNFLSTILEKRCRYRDCTQCGYCDAVAAEVLKIEKSYSQESLQLHAQIDELLVSGKMWL
ncbi:MAG: U32 family peptidase [Oligoflexia bacterium]|nr:U32 family peptidase [Oligoflexia bacterium]